MSTLLAVRPSRMLGFSPRRRRPRRAGWIDVAIEWDRRARDRVRLARTLPCHLDDMGLTPDFVAAECAKPFWRA